MRRAPVSLTKRLSSSERAEIDRWWERLAPAEKCALRDERRPALIGRFVEDSFVEPSAIDFFEYLVNHEIELADQRVWHICSKHPEARSAISRGLVPASFRCPREDASCPMRAILASAPGLSLRLSVRA